MARIISRRQMDDIRVGNDIAEVIGSYMTLKRAGSAFKALCPFHKEKTPSFHVNPQRQIYHCFGCGAGGDVFSFVMQHEGVDFMTAARMLAQRAGLALELEDGEGGDASLKEILYRIHQGVAEFYRRCLLQMPSAAEARRYLEQRDLSATMAEGFMIGFAPDRWDSVLRWGEKHKHGPEHLEQAGLVVPREREGSAKSYYDRFRNRLMFPISDEQGRVIGFSGRALEAGPRTAKYVNSPESLLFKKSRVLYAMDKARRVIVDSREAIVCEGQIDVIRCHQVGLAAAVAAQGTAFTEEHARILKRYADSVCLVFDPDKAGQDASVRAAAVFMEAGLAVRVAALPAGDDPDSFIRKRGIEAFRAIVNKAESAVGFQVGVLSAHENLGSQVGVMRAAKSVLQTILHCPGAVQRARLVQEASQRLNIPASALMDDLAYMLRRRRAPSPHDQGLAAEDATGAETPRETAKANGKRARPREEVELCAHLTRIVDCPELGKLVERYLPLRMFTDPECRAVAEASLEGLRTGEELQSSLRRRGASEELQRFAAQVQMAPAKTKGREFSQVDAARGLILSIWRRHFEEERARLAREETREPAAERAERRAQITYHLSRLRKWEDGADVIEFESDAL